MSANWARTSSRASAKPSETYSVYCPCIVNDLTFEFLTGELYSGWGLAKALLTIPQRQTAGPIKSEMEASPVNTAMVLTPSGKFFALNEGGAPFELELDWDGAIQHLVGFETKSGRLDFPLSAHPKVDRATGEVFFHGYSLLSSKAFLRTGRLGADGKVSPSPLCPASTRTLTLARRGREGGGE